MTWAPLTRTRRRGGRQGAAARLVVVRVLAAVGRSRRGRAVGAVRLGRRRRAAARAGGDDGRLQPGRRTLGPEAECAGRPAIGGDRAAPAPARDAPVRRRARRRRPARPPPGRAARRPRARAGPGRRRRHPRAQPAPLRLAAARARAAACSGSAPPACGAGRPAGRGACAARTRRRRPQGARRAAARGAPPGPGGPAHLRRAAVVRRLSTGVLPSNTNTGRTRWNSSLRRAASRRGAPLLGVGAGKAAGLTCRSCGKSRAGARCV